MSRRRSRWGCSDPKGATLVARAARIRIACVRSLPIACVMAAGRVERTELLGYHPGQPAHWEEGVGVQESPAGILGRSTVVV